MQLSVIELNRTDLATEEDKHYQIDKWVTFFKSKTWKELKDMAATNQYMEAAANTIFEINSDENIRELCRRRAGFEAYERYNAAEHARKDKLLTEKDSEIAEKDSKLAEKDSEIARLKALLAQADTIKSDEINVLHVN